MAILLTKRANLFYRFSQARFLMTCDEERSHSGLVRRLGKAVWGQPHRGFKSLPLRHM